MTLSLALATVLVAAAALLSLWLLARLRRERTVKARLASSEARFRQLVEAADDVIFRTDAEGRFSYANPAAKEALRTRRSARSWLTALSSPGTASSSRRSPAYSK